MLNPTFYWTGERESHVGEPHPHKFHRCVQAPLLLEEKGLGVEVSVSNPFELAAAMGSEDRRQRHLDQAILRLLPEEIHKNNPLCNLGLDHCLQRGRGQAQVLKQVMDALRLTVADLFEAFSPAVK